MRTALYAGSFDPITRGHEDLVRRGFAIADRIVVAVATNASKQPLFTVDERVALIREALGGDPRIEVRAFGGLLVHLARDVGATTLVRGVRGVADFEYESGMAHMNRHLMPSLETVFLTPSAGMAFVSSSLVRDVARHGGDVSALVHPAVAAALRARFAA